MLSHISSFFFFNDTATTEIYTLSLHDALPILIADRGPFRERAPVVERFPEEEDWLALPVEEVRVIAIGSVEIRSEEHTSELQSQSNLVCRLLLEKKKSQSRSHRRRNSRSDNVV